VTRTPAGCARDGAVRSAFTAFVKDTNHTGCLVARYY
jgi:hypothetical protein